MPTIPSPTGRHGAGSDLDDPAVSTTGDATDGDHDDGLTGSDTVTAPWYTHHRGSAVMLLVTAVVGMIATGILVAERLALLANPDYVTSCDLNPWVSCGTVMQSAQATTFGFPNQYIGLVAFPVVITVAMGLLAGARYRRWYWAGLNLGVAAGLAFCVYLWFQAVYVITVLCLYCMVVWAMMIPMFVLLTVRNLQHDIIPSSPRVKKLAAEWAWPVIVLLYVGVIASILLRFGLSVFQLA